MIGACVIEKNTTDLDYLLRNHIINQKVLIMLFRCRYLIQFWVSLVTDSVSRTRERICGYVW